MEFTSTLIETYRPRGTKTLFGLGVTSLAAHAALIGAAVYATLAARPADTAVRVDTTAVLLTPEPEKQTTPPSPQLADVLRGFQTLTVPTQLPTTLPPVNLQERFDPRDFSGMGVEGGRADGLAPGGDGAYAEAVVEERPSLLSAPQPRYPALLKEAGVQGRVLLRAIVDTTGRVEPTSVEVASSPNAAFDASARDWILHALFRPARVHGKAVRVHITQPLDYSITSG